MYTMAKITQNKCKMVDEAMNNKDLVIIPNRKKKKALIIIFL